MPYFSDRKKSKLTHQHSFYLWNCARSQLKKKEDISSVPQVRKLVVKTQQWHILWIVLSPLTLYWVLQGDRKHTKSFCTKKKKRRGLCARAEPTPYTSRPQTWPQHNPSNRTARRGAWWERFQTNPNATKDGVRPVTKGFPSGKGPRGHRSPSGPSDPRTRRAPSEMERGQMNARLRRGDDVQLSLFHPHSAPFFPSPSLCPV